MKSRVIKADNLKGLSEEDVLAEIAMDERLLRLKTMRGQELSASLKSKSITKKDFEEELKKIKI